MLNMPTVFLDQPMKMPLAKSYQLAWSQGWFVFVQVCITFVQLLLIYLCKKCITFAQFFADHFCANLYITFAQI